MLKNTGVVAGPEGPADVFRGISLGRAPTTIRPYGTIRFDALRSRAKVGGARRLPPRARPQWGRPRSDGRKDWCPAPRRARDPKPRVRAILRCPTPPTPPPHRGGGVGGAVFVRVGVR